MNYTIEAMDSVGVRFEVGSLCAALGQLQDKRKRRGIRYSLAVILTLVVLAKLAGEDELAGIAEWVKLRAEQLVAALGLKREQVPHQTTYSRVLGHGVDIEEFEQVVGAFFRQQVKVDQVALDGKAMRGTIEPGQTQGVYLLAAYVPGTGIVLGQETVANDENELVVAPDLLDSLDLEGVVVTGDALFTQRDLSEQIVNAGGDYVWIVKDNQETLRQDIERLFASEFCLPGTNELKTDFTIARQTDKAHGRLEQRTLTASSLLASYLDWPDIQQVFKLEHQTAHLKSGKHSHEIFYGITSLSPPEASSSNLLIFRRQHWLIENRLHYCRDVTLREDACRLRTGHAPRTMAILNNLTLNLLRLAGFQRIPNARRYFNAHPMQAVRLLAQPFA
jgi:predicted transposase YbfD/YdcC